MEKEAKRSNPGKKSLVELFKTNLIFRLFVIFFVVQVALSFGLGNTINFGKNPDTGRFSIWIQETPHGMDIKELITEEFQPDQYYKEHGIQPKIYGSVGIYNFFRKVFGEENAITAFELIRMLIIVDLTLLLLVYYLRKYLFDRPSQPQVLFEMVYSFFEDLTCDTLGEHKRHFTPYALTIFIFLWTCNMIGLIPIPGFMEPTRNLNVPLGMGVIAIIVVHFMAIKHKGVGEYLKGYTEPFLPFAPINLVGELSKTISISFRLFGNILGGAIIMLVVGVLVRFILLPIGLTLFFGLFIGTIQAFVFTMLSLSYIAVEIAE